MVSPFEPTPDTKLVDNDDELTVRFIEEPIYDPFNQKPDTSSIHKIRHDGDDGL